MASSSTPISKWLWFSGIAMPIAFAVFLNYLAELTPQYQATHFQASSHSANAKGNANPEFSFYKNLPQNTLKLEVAPLNDPAKKPAKTLANTTTDKNRANSKANPAFADDVKRQFGSRVLQVGSYKKLKDADQKRAELALLGLEATIEKANVGNNQIWYRVNLGPFDEEQTINSVQNTLTLYDIPSLTRSAKQ